MDKEPALTAQGTRGSPRRGVRTPRRRDQIHECAQASLRLARSVLCTTRTSRAGVLKTRAGTFAETSSPEDQLHWIFENCKVVRGANGLPNIIEAMKIASSKHDLLWLVIHVFPNALLTPLQQPLRTRRCSFSNFGPGPRRYPRGGHYGTLCIPGDAVSRHRSIQRSRRFC